MKIYLKRTIFDIFAIYFPEKIDSFNFRIRFCERYKSIEKVTRLLKSNQVFLILIKTRYIL